MPRLSFGGDSVRDVAVIVPAAGAGVRLGGDVPKALRELAGEPLLLHAVRRLTRAESVGLVVVAAPPQSVDLVADLVTRDAGTNVIVVAGGATRQESVSLALKAVPDEYAIVLVHDAARALTPPD